MSVIVGTTQRCRFHRRREGHGSVRRFSLALDPARAPRHLRPPTRRGGGGGGVVVVLGPRNLGPGVHRGAAADGQPPRDPSRQEVRDEERWRGYGLLFPALSRLTVEGVNPVFPRSYFNDLLQSCRNLVFLRLVSCNFASGGVEALPLKLDLSPASKLGELVLAACNFNGVRLVNTRAEPREAGDLQVRSSVLPYRRQRPKAGDPGVQGYSAMDLW